MSRKIFIYGLKDPRDGRIKYVGQTVNMTARMASHCNIASPARTKKGKWVEELNKKGLSAVPVVLETCDEHDAPEREAHWIQQMSKEGPMFNHYYCRLDPKPRRNDGKSGLAMKVTKAERDVIAKAAKLCGRDMGKFAVAVTLAKAKEIISLCAESEIKTIYVDFSCIEKQASA